jgi:hypothetical protein
MADGSSVMALPDRKCTDIRNAQQHRLDPTLQPIEDAVQP